MFKTQRLDILNERRITYIIMAEKKKDSEKRNQPASRSIAMILVIGLVILAISFYTSRNRGISPEEVFQVKSEAIAGSDASQLAASAELPMVGIQKGDVPPDFALTAVDGIEASLNNGHTAYGNPAVVYFWATWCPYCKQDFEVLKDIYPEYDQEVEFIAINLDPAESEDKIKNYAEKLGIEGIRFVKADPAVVAEYGVKTTTTKFAIGRSGTILWTGSGAADEDVWRIILGGLRDSG